MATISLISSIQSAHLWDKYGLNDSYCWSQGQWPNACTISLNEIITTVRKWIADGAELHGKTITCTTQRRLSVAGDWVKSNDIPFGDGAMNIHDATADLVAITIKTIAVENGVVKILVMHSNVNHESKWFNCPAWIG